MEVYLKSTRCTTNKSHYTLRIQWLDGGIIANCSEDVARIHVGDGILRAGPQMSWMSPIRFVAQHEVNCFEEPEAMWEHLRGLLLNASFCPFTEGAGKWFEPPKIRNFHVGGFYCRIGDDVIPIDITSGVPMPAYWNAIKMNAECMEPTTGRR